MPEFEIVDLTEPPEPPSRARTARGTAQAIGVGRIDTAAVAASLEALRKDISATVTAPTKGGLRVTNLVVKLTLSAEGSVAFIAKGAAEASIEVTFAPAP